ncbi:TOBE domain-containing protein, partial [Haloarcula nitratireducens]
RPEDLTLHDDPTGGHEFEAVVDVVEPMGSISYVYLQPRQQDHGEPFIAETDGQRPISEGSEVYVEIPDEDIHLFDAKTGETIHQRKLDADAELALEDGMQTVSSSSD